jgi:hypothetical protein
MKSFFDTDFCVNERDCVLCRSLSKPASRHTIAQRHGLEPDFPCPKGYAWDYVPPAPVQLTVERKPPKIGPGSVMGAVLKELGYTKKPGCGCAAFAAKMNAWGWVGCVRHRKEIMAWFHAKAVEAGTPLTPRGVWKIVKQAMKHQIKGA